MKHFCWIIIFAIGIIFHYVVITDASPPSNDVCNNALMISSLPYENIVNNISNATYSRDDFTTDVVVEDTCYGFFDYNLGNIWYTWTPGTTGFYNIVPKWLNDLLQNGYIAIYEGTTCSLLKFITCSGFGIIDLNLIAGTQYFIEYGVVAYQEIEKVISGNYVTINIMPYPPSPINQKCTNATEIPSNPILPYTTSPVLPATLPIDISDPTIPDNECNFFTRNGNKLWYTWTPSNSGVYDLIINYDAYSGTGQLNLNIGMLIFTNINENSTTTGCAASDLVLCTTNTVRSFNVIAGTTYYIAISFFTRFFDGNGAVSLQIRTLIPPPINDECRNAIEINSTNDVTVLGSTTNARTINELGDVYYLYCGQTNLRPSVWYKITNTKQLITNVRLSTCNDITNFATLLAIYKPGTANSGEDVCNNLECVIFQDFDGFETNDCQYKATVSFVLPVGATYYILLQGQSSQGDFALTVQEVPNYFALMDAKLDVPIELLGTYFSYRSVPSSQLNIQAQFDPELPISSVRVQFDNPRRSHCENTYPYSIFGDTDGDFRFATIPVGPHNVSATAYSNASCRGRPLKTLSQSFDVTGCSDSVVFYNSDSSNLGQLYEGGQYTLSGCNATAIVFTSCAFEIDIVTMTLRNNITKTILYKTNERRAPYFLFGDYLYRPIPTGTYTFELSINQIVHRPITFKIIQGQCP